MTVTIRESAAPGGKGPFAHRLLMGFLTLLLTVLLIWLLGFILSDIGKWPGPDREALEAEYIDPELEDRLEQLQREKARLSAEIENQRDIQEILRSSADNSQQTMNQLLELNRRSLARDMTPSAEEQEALVESQRIFLENQRAFQEANRTIAELGERLREANRQIEETESALREQREPLEEEWRRLMRNHSFKVASAKLGLLMPLFVLAAWGAIRKRGAAYAPLYYAAFIAVFWRTGLVMHQYFPSEFFKYIAISVSIAVVLAFMLHLIRSAVRPKPGMLLRRYREAYTRLRCPVCDYPIGKGRLKFLRWTKRGPDWGGSGASVEDAGGERPYTCPSCGSALFEPCPHCGGIRHSLLPYCEHCGRGGTGPEGKAPPEPADAAPQA